MSSQKRRYTLKARAQQQAETRRRIVEATSALHDEVGPARTTVAEIARRAGVQRLTVYNNFPDEKELFAACSNHWLSQNPPPDPFAALAIESPAERLRAVLGPVYSWYRRTSRTNENLQRDRLVMPALDAMMRIRMDEQFAKLTDVLMAAFNPVDSSAKGLRAAVALALDFWTWRRLAGEGLSDDDAAALMVNAVKAAAQP
ncbi:MAG: TetR/AcrR family transcriptional regulator [Candidatus Dormibacteraeota bacterium]|uniref:TetR/AcrR family transcriptional regulator n=1 Tax=Candidatus Dormiibacter inghamiae TaxID=3127013 RepID=A0A934NCE5_9BACT|nr:TetR/AcrR family transcriptional regulator [Candidatus Dormibacteraeota bacterium]MBJ7605580.1 TetR/AcrR family transcriptional regulator [Candidatus Dormibacteraeota bacterium]